MAAWVAGTPAELKLKTGETAWTNVTPDDIWHYMNGGSKTGAIKAWLGTSSTPTDYIYVGIHAIVYVKR